MPKISFVLVCMATMCATQMAAQDLPKKTYPFYATAGLNQLVTTEFSSVEVPTASGIQTTLGIGPFWRLTAEGQFSAHRLLGANDAVKNGYLLSYAWRAGIVPHKPVPILFYAGGGYHVYHITFQPVKAMGVDFLPSIRTRRLNDYLTFGASYPFYKCFEVDLSYRREAFFRNNREINANYISLGVNAWLYKYDRFARVKKGALSE
jgi:Outer membrane protein beta-barrel domain